MKKALLLRVVYLSLGAVAMTWIGVLNGFPLAYTDTVTYLLSGMKLATPVDRPITYGLFILVTSFGGRSLFSVLFFQSLVLVYLMELTFRAFSSVKQPAKWAGASAVLVAFLTGVSWTSSQLIADVFVPATILSSVLLLCTKNLSKGQMAWVMFLFLMTVSSHIANMAITLTVVLCWIFIRLWNKEREGLLKKAGIVMVLLAGAMLVMSSTIAKSKHVFLAQHMHDLGLLKIYLDEYCDEIDYAICPYRDSIPGDFIWDLENSPMYKSGLGWKGSKTELNQIIQGIIRTPRYWGRLVGASFYWTAEQLVTFKGGNGNHSFADDHRIYETLDQYFPGQSDRFRNSRQNQDRLLSLLPFWTVIHSITFGISLLLIAIFLVFPGQWDIKDRIEIRPVYLILFAILMNAAICVTIITVIDRFGCRVTWLFSFLAIFLVANWWTTRQPT
ncbi:MAG: hypothetical protein AAF598_08235 [Bacteroidota bacterium]